MSKNDAQELLARSLFCKLVESRRLRKAAFLAHVPPSAAAELLARLERRESEPLLRREGALFLATDQGLARYREWRGALETLDQLGLDKRFLAVSLPTTTGATLLTPEITRFALAHQGLQIDIRLTYGSYHPLWEGVDLRIGHGEYLLEDVASWPLGMVERICVANPRYLEASPAVLKPADLARPEVFGSKSLTRAERIRLTRNSRTVEVAIQPAVTLRSHLSALHCALQGLGIAVMVPAYLAQPYLIRGELVQVLADWHLPALPLRAFTEAGRTDPVLSELILSLQAFCEATPGISPLEEHGP